MSVTREQVAKRAGVCKQTVSCYFNGTRGVSRKAAERIDQAVKELNYVPNLIARSLSKQETKTLAVICGNISNPNYSEIISGIEKAAQEKDYTIMIFNAKGNCDKAISEIISRKVDGVILLTFKSAFGQFNLSKLEEYRVEMVVTHSGGEVSEKHMQLEPDFYFGIDQAVARLQELGHEKICMLSCFRPDYPIDKRLPCFIDSCTRRFGKEPLILFPEQNLDASFQTGSMLAERLLETGSECSAVIATNDLMAIGASQVFSERGKTFSVIGIDNTVFAQYVSPPLSSIGYDKMVYGKKLFEMFLERRLGAPPRIEFVKTFLIERESILPPQAAEQAHEN